MNILIIYTYPNHQSFNDAILKVVHVIIAVAMAPDTSLTAL